MTKWFYCSSSIEIWVWEDFNFYSGGLIKSAGEIALFSPAAHYGGLFVLCLGNWFQMFL